MTIKESNKLLINTLCIVFSEIQNGLAGPKALFSYACLFMQCWIFSKFTGPHKILQDMSFGSADFGKSGFRDKQHQNLVDLGPVEDRKVSPLWYHSQCDLVWLHSLGCQWLPIQPHSSWLLSKAQLSCLAEWWSPDDLRC